IISNLSRLRIYIYLCIVYPMPKYRDYFRQMLEVHKDEFEKFAEVHAKYQLDQNKWQEEYNKIGAPIKNILYEWEKKLCGHSEKGNFAKFSSQLAEKFQQEVKAFFPLVDFIGVKVNKPIEINQSESKVKAK